MLFFHCSDVVKSINNLLKKSVYVKKKKSKKVSFNRKFKKANQSNHFFLTLARLSPVALLILPPKNYRFLAPNCAYLYLFISKLYLKFIPKFTPIKTITPPLYPDLIIPNHTYLYSNYI